MFHILLLIFYLFRDMKSNLSGSLWGLPVRRWMISRMARPNLGHSAPNLKALDPIQGN